MRLTPVQDQFYMMRCADFEGRRDACEDVVAEGKGSGARIGQHRET